MKHHFGLSLNLYCLVCKIAITIANAYTFLRRNGNILVKVVSCCADPATQHSVPKQTVLLSGLGLETTKERVRKPPQPHPHPQKNLSFVNNSQ